MPNSLLPFIDKRHPFRGIPSRLITRILIGLISLPLASCPLDAEPSFELHHRGVERFEGTAEQTDFTYDEASNSYFLPIGGPDYEMNRSGEILRVDLSGRMETVVKFTGQIGPAKGRLPRGAVTRGPDGKYYGVTRNGGHLDKGTIFRFSSAGEFETLLEFNNTGAAHPTGGLLLGPDALFYGVTTSGGSHGHGTVFKIDASGSVTHFAHFTERTGFHPVDGLTLGVDGALYGLTDEAGAFGFGSIYKVTPHQGQLTAVVHFSGNGAPNGGRMPCGKLLRHTDGFLYGVTQRGGPQDRGTIFKLGANETFTTLFQGFDNSQSFPASSLAEGKDGKLYGLTASALVQGIQAGLYSITTSGQFNTFSSLGEINQKIYLGRNRPTLASLPDGSFFAAVDLSVMHISQQRIRIAPLTPGFPTGLPQLVAAQDGSIAWTSAYWSNDTLEQTTQLYHLAPNQKLTNLATFISKSAFTRLAVDDHGRIHGATSYYNTLSDQFFSISPGESQPEIRTVSGVANTIQLLAESSGTLYALADGGLYLIPAFGSANKLLGLATSSTDGISWGPDGAIYGVSRKGGAFGGGYLYRCTTAGAAATIYDFGDPKSSIAPRFPYGAVAFGDDGSIYGTSEQGGGDTEGYGAAFVYANGLMKAVALRGRSRPLTRGADGRLYGIRQLYDPFTDYSSALASGTIEILRFEPSLSFTAVPIFPSALVSSQSQILGGGDPASVGFTAAPDGTLFILLSQPAETLPPYALYRLAFNQPIVDLAPASELTANGVTLHGTVDHRQDPETVSYFEIGLSASELRRIRTAPAAGEGQAVSLEVFGLHPDTQYYYRLRSTNSGGSAQTTVATFRTPPGNKLPEFKPFLARATVGIPAVIPMATLLAAMSDPDGGTPSVAAVRPSSDRGGSASLAEATGLTYLAAPGFRGMDAVSLDIIDAQGGRVTVIFPIEVIADPESQNHTDHIGLLEGGQLLIVLFGEAGKVHNLEQSTDLLGWAAASSQTTGADGSFIYLLNIPPRSTSFYRLAPPPE